MRTEKDSLGEVNLPDDACYGINAYRSTLIFPRSDEKVNPHFIKAYFMVKMAAAETNYKCGLLFKEKFDAIEEAIDSLIDETDDAIEGISDTIYSKIIVDCFQGGAGTVFNMNINEVIANTALKLSGKNAGDYNFINPIDDINMSQSSNDTYMTSLKIAAIFMMREMLHSYETLEGSLRAKEEEFRNILKLGRTEYQDAVPITLGQEFGAYRLAIERDRSRLAAVEKKFRLVNLGGTIVGNSISAGSEYVMNVIKILRKITGLHLEKGENLIDMTQNLDDIMEVHSLLKTSATNIIKMSSDLIFLSSGPKGGIGEITLPSMQTGSSIMPGKINPVILEYAVQTAEFIKANDLLISNLISSGHLELNPFLPLIMRTFLRSIEMMKNINMTLAEKCINGIIPNQEKCRKNLIESSAIAASLIPAYGYETIQKIVNYSEVHNIPFVKALIKSKLMDENELFSLLSSEMGIEL